MMRKKIAALFCTLAVLCACLCGTAFAAKKPSIELMAYMPYGMSLWYRNRLYIFELIPVKRLNTQIGMYQHIIV